MKKGVVQNILESTSEPNLHGRRNSQARLKGWEGDYHKIVRKITYSGKLNSFKGWVSVNTVINVFWTLIQCNILLTCQGLIQDLHLGGVGESQISKNIADR